MARSPEIVAVKCGPASPRCHGVWGQFLRAKAIPSWGSLTFWPAFWAVHWFHPQLAWDLPESVSGRNATRRDANKSSSSSSRECNKLGGTHLKCAKSKIDFYTYYSCSFYKISYNFMSTSYFIYYFGATFLWEKRARCIFLNFSSWKSFFSVKISFQI